MLPCDTKLYSILSPLNLAWQIEPGKPANMGGSAKEMTTNQKKPMQLCNALTCYWVTVYFDETEIDMSKLAEINNANWCEFPSALEIQ